MTGWIAGLVLAAAAVIFVLVYRYQIKRLLGRIIERLDGAIAGRRAPEQYNEGMEAVIGQRLNQFLAISEENARRADREREIIRGFLSDVTHQVKTPLSNILVYAQLLEGQPDMDQDSRDMLLQMEQQVEKLDFLVHNLKKASQLELDMIQLHRSKESVDELIWSSCQLAEPAAHKKGIRILWEPGACADGVDDPGDFSSAADGPAQVMGCYRAAADGLAQGAVGSTHDASAERYCSMDMRWMQEALGNILDNAVKYSPPGSAIAIDVMEYELFYRINVKDEGPGISEEEQGLIFSRFYRSERTGKEPGLGIGLYLTREIVMRHGGYVEVHSEVGHGAEFSVFLRRD